VNIKNYLSTKEMKMNTFSPEKIFFHYEKIRRYLKTGEIFPPMFLDIDISGYCNNKCYFCNAVSSHNKVNLTLEQVDNIIFNMKNINTNINAVCLSGGGEPTLNTEFIQISELISNKYKMKKMLNTNGLMLEKLYNDLYDFTSIGISIDSYDDSYMITRRYPEEGHIKVINGIEKLCKVKSKNNIKDVTAKVLITKFNYNALYDISLILKDTGVDNIYIRPANLYGIRNVDNFGFINNEDYFLDKKELHVLNKQLKECSRLSDKYCKVICVNNTTKYDFTTPLLEFKTCIACMVSLTFSTDGYVYTCINQRQNDNFKLCKHSEIKEYFNSEKHKSMIKNINPKECKSCFRNKLNKYIQEFILEDKANIDFL